VINEDGDSVSNVVILIENTEIHTDHHARFMFRMSLRESDVQVTAPGYRQARLTVYANSNPVDIVLKRK
jgi:hypothetical protein